MQGTFLLPLRLQAEFIAQQILVVLIGCMVNGGDPLGSRDPQH